MSYHFRVIHDYVTSYEGELCLKSGDLVSISSDFGDGWVYGENEGKTGKFPKVFVEEIRNEEDEDDNNSVDDVSDAESSTRGRRGRHRKRQAIKVPGLNYLVRSMQLDDIGEVSMNVHFPDFHFSKQFMFDSETFLYEIKPIVLRSLIEEKPTVDPNEMKTYALCLKSLESQDIWLEDKNPLWTYAIRSDDIVEFKNRTKSIQQPTQIFLRIVSPEQGISKILRFEITSTIQEIIPIVAENFNLSSGKHYGIFLKKELILDEDETLQSLGISSMETIEFKQKPLFEVEMVSGENNSNEKLSLEPNVTVQDAMKQMLSHFASSNSLDIETLNIRQVGPGGSNWMEKSTLLSVNPLRVQDILEVRNRNDSSFAMSFIVKRIPSDLELDGIPSANKTFPMLKGEKVVLRVNNVKLMIRESSSYLGEFNVTNFKIVFKSYSNKDYDVFLPLATIQRIEKKKEGSLFSMKFYSKDIRIVTLGFTKKSTSETISIKELPDFLLKSVFVEQQTNLFAFSYREEFPQGQDGWMIYKFEDEFKRQGIALSPKWRFTMINLDYGMSASYPSKLVVPQGISDEQLKSVFHFRSKGRIPAVVWKHPVKTVTISRASQPLVGLKGKRCQEDELLIQEILKSSGSEKLYVMDARPKKNAYANTAMGAGYENTSFYPNCKIKFLEIGNIHVMRNSFQNLCSLALSDEEEVGWFSQIDSTHWLDHIRIILSGTFQVIEYIEKEGASVLLHCSDGWDRTAQLSSLSQLLLDPYYRTLKGFEVLLEKEWTSFGHKFAQRIGHGKSNYSDEQRSPIFLQFIDCVWQLKQQFPLAFEFNDEMLVFIMDALYSCQFGTFLFNNEKERSSMMVQNEFGRMQISVQDKTVSLWSYINHHHTKFRNPFFQPVDDVLFPDCSMKNLHLWESYYLRFSQGAAVARSLRQFDQKIAEVNEMNK